jgi:phosphoglycerate dehydrogenase-like enzyme
LEKSMLLPKENLTICFAHAAYHFQREFQTRQSGINSFEVRTRDDLAERIGEADVLVVSSLWRNDLFDGANRLRFVQCNGAGTEQFDIDQFRQRGLRLASGQGTNSNAVSHHGMALILALTRRLPDILRWQSKAMWRPMTGNPDQREDELTGKTLVVVGYGHVGRALASLARAFGMRIIGLKRNPNAGSEGADAVHRMDELHSVLPLADIVALTCPLTKETEKFINKTALSRMKKSAILVNLSRGRCVDEVALIDALKKREIAGAGLDVFVQEPLPAESPFWGMENVIVTPHSAGETRHYEANVIDLLNENIGRLRRGEAQLRNQVV